VDNRRVHLYDSGMTLLPRTLIVVLSGVLLPLGVHGRPQSERAHLTSTAVRCVLAVDDRLWKGDEPALVNVSLENLTDNNLNLKVIPEFFLKGPEEYSAPTDSAHNGPIGVKEKPIGKGGAIGIRPIKLRLHLNKRSTSTFEVDAAMTKWDRVISSVWPSRLLGSLRAGRYLLYLEFEDTEGKIVRSNGVAVGLSN
jgi:hypothetical protein